MAKSYLAKFLSVLYCICIPAYLYLFAKSRFTKGCMVRVKEMGNVVLVRDKEIVGIENAELRKQINQERKDMQ